MLTERLLLTEHVDAYAQSERAKEAVKLLKGKYPVYTKEQHSLVRNYLIFCITINNACRAGAVVNLTLEQVATAQPVDGKYVVKVRVHLYEYINHN